MFKFRRRTREDVRATPKRPKSRCRRLLLEQLETRALLTGGPHGLPSGEFIPPDDRVSQIYWEVSELIRLGRTDELPPRTTPMTSETAPGWSPDTVQYDDQFHLYTELFTLGTSPELLSALSGLASSDCPTYSPPIAIDIADPVSWSRTTCWIDPANLDRVLELPQLMRVDFVAVPDHQVVTVVPTASNGQGTLADLNHIDQQLHRVLHHVATARRAGNATLSANSVAVDVAVDPNSVRLEPDGTVQVEVYFRQGQQSVADQLKEAGIRVGRSYIPHGVLEAWISESDLPVFADMNDLLYGAMPTPIDHQVGTYNTAGDTILGASEVRSRFAAQGVNGSGIRIGVISDGVSHLADAVTGGELPGAPNAVVVNPSISGSGDEGTALLEIVHDLAPGAGLYFSSAATVTDVIAGIQYLRNQGVHVIVDDIVSLTEPFFVASGGAIAVEVAAAIAQGISYVSSAGNYNQRHYQAMSAIGATGRNDFNPSATVDETLDVNIPANTTAKFYLQWSDAWGQSSNNFDLIVLDSTETTILAQSTTVQNGDDLASETVTVPSTGTARTVKVRVTGPQTPVRELELFASPSSLTIQEPTYIAQIAPDGIIGHQGIDGTITVGAINASDPDHDTIANYSVVGPTTVYTNFTTQTKVARSSLDVAGIDGVSTLASQSGWAPFTSGTQFFGTSAAAPHVAAIVGLMRDAAGTSPVNYTTTLNSTAVDLGAVGYDNTYGSGRANALEAVYSAFKPTTAPDLTAASDNGVSSTDNLTSLTALTLTGSVPAGSYVSLYNNGGAPIASQQLVAGVTNYSLTANVSSNATHKFSIRVKSSSTSANYSQASPELTVYVDAIAAYVPPAPDLMTAFDTGSSNTDNITSHTTPAFNGTLAANAAGAVVTLWIDGNLVRSLPLGPGVTYYSIFSTTLASGNHSAVIRARLVTAAPAGSYYASPALPFTVDTLPPSAVIASVGSPGNAPPQSPFQITFNKAVTGVDLADFTLTKSGGGGANRLPGTAVLAATGNPLIYEISHFHDITMASGSYVLTLNYAGSNIQSVAGVAASGTNPATSWSQGNSGFQNALRYFDVNDDTFVSPIDALQVINALDVYQGPLPGGPYSAPPPYLDAQGDSQLSPIDALVVINFINEYGSSGPYLMAGGDPPPPVTLEDVTANVELEIVDATGAPVSAVQVGDQFELRARLVLNAPLQVVPFAAYNDVRFTPGLISPVASDGTVLQRRSSEIDEAGGLLYDVTTGDSSALIFSQAFVATKQGLVTFDADAADLFGHDILVTGLNQPLPLSQIQFGSTSLRINAK